MQKDKGRAKVCNLQSEDSFLARPTYRILLNYSFRLLAGKAYSCAEIKERLRRRAKKLNGLSRAGEPKDDSKKAEDAKIDAAAIKKVLDKLIELKYLDDAKILENFLCCFPTSLVNKSISSNSLSDVLPRNTRVKWRFSFEVHAQGISGSVFCTWSIFSFRDSGMLMARNILWSMD